MDSIVIPNAFDSHVHWMLTGAFLEQLQLDHIKDKSDLKKIKVEDHHKLQDWITGWGWSLFQFEKNIKDGFLPPHRNWLDEIWPQNPVAFTSHDGHSLWVNTEALKRAGLYTKNSPSPDGGRISLDEQGWPTGLLYEAACDSVRKIIPEPSVFQKKRYLERAKNYFNKNGITHIRDMTGSEEQFHLSLFLVEKPDWTLAVIQNFLVSEANDFERQLQLILRLKKLKLKHIKIGALKIFFDGSLGSETALLSQPYLTSQQKGLQLIERVAFKEMLERAWQAGIDVAVHCIGDEAAERVMTIATELWELNIEGRLHIEHAQMLRDETIKKMQGRNVVCHMQPNHWLSDKNWLDKKLCLPLFSTLFRWADLEKLHIPFFFGSDSPVEAPSLFQNQIALDDAALAGITKPLRASYFYQSFPDPYWTPQTSTEIKNGKIEKVLFKGRLCESSWS